MERRIIRALQNDNIQHVNNVNQIGRLVGCGTTNNARFSNLMRLVRNVISHSNPQTIYNLRVDERVTIESGNVKRRISVVFGV